ncbi:MAG: TonB-dependent receptor [Bacteroidota bacterium]
MKHFYFLLLLCGFLGIQSARAQSAGEKAVLNDTAKVDRFFSSSLDAVLDYFTANYKIRFVFDRQQMQDINIADRYKDETVKDVIKFICKRNGLYYARQADGTYFIMKSLEDLPRLKRAPALALRNVAAEEDRSRYAVGASPALKTAAALLPKPAVLGPLAVRRDLAVSGRVTDQLTGESLPAATVKVMGTSILALCNADGYFTLSKVPADTVILLISFAGYQTAQERLTAASSSASLVIGLLPAYNALNEVEIAGKRNGIINTDPRKVSVIQLSPAKLAELPSMGERDILRAFQLMPGIGASNESSSGAYVRGGTPDQNLVLFDGFTVYQVDHLYGFFSAFNANAVKDVQMYKGGFSSRFGGRLSSVTDISGKEGNKKDINFGGDLSLLSLNLYGETPLGSKSSALFSIRRSYQGILYDKIFGKLSNPSAATTTPQGGAGGFGGRGGGAADNQTQISSWFYDLNGKYTFTPNDRNIFSISYYSGSDDLDNSRDLGIPGSLATTLNSSSIVDLTKYGNLGSSAKWSSRWSNKLYSNTLVSYSSYFSDRNRSTSNSVTDSADVTSTVANGTFENNDLKDFSAKSDWEYTMSNKAKLLFGGFASLQDIKYVYAQNDTSTLIDQHNRGTTLGGYGELELTAGKLLVQPGLRLTHYNVTGKAYLEPRFSASYALSDRWMLKGATGRFYQFANRVIREDILAGSKDFWVLADGKNIPVGSAFHYIAGASYETDQFLWSVEGYYKTLTGLTEYSLRQLRTGGFRNGTVTLEENFYNGRGYARGVEFLLQKKTGRYTGWIGYTLGQAYNNFSAYGTDYFPANHDVTQEFKSINMYHYGRWTVSATWIYATGKPYTAPIGSFTIDRPGGGTITSLTITGKNTERLPAYHRLDAALTYDLVKVNTSKIGSIGFSLFNIYNRVNTWYREYQLQGNQVISTDVNYMGLTPNLTLTLKWK